MSSLQPLEQELLENNNIICITVILLFMLVSVDSLAVISVDRKVTRYSVQ